MSSEIEHIVDAALRLSARERELIIDRLRDSLHNDDTRTDLKALSMQEATLRVERLRRGELQLLGARDTGDRQDTPITPELLPTRR